MSFGPSRRDLIRALGAFTAAGTFAPTAARAGTPVVALVHTQAAGDNGGVDGMIASLKRIGRERNITVRAVYANDAANYQPILELLGEAQCKVVLTTFEEMSQPLRAVAPRFPNTRFIQIYGDPMEPPVANIRTVSYETHLTGYLSGVFGALVTKTNKIGYIGGVSIPNLDASVNAQIAGAKTIRPDIKMSTAFVGSFQDPAKAFEIANQMFGDDVDYVQAEGSASDLGVIQSANRHPGRLVAGGARLQCQFGPATVAAVEVCDFELSLYQQANAALASDWVPGHYRTGLQDRVVDFVLSQLFLEKAPPVIVARVREVWPQIAAAKNKIIAGTVKVLFKTNLG